jgi:hypothetical protein
MQICGQEVNIEEIKDKTAELQSLMSDPEVLASIESKVAEMNEKLNSFKPEIPEVPSLQEALSELNAELSSPEFAAKLKKIKSDFGEVVDDLPEILNRVNPKLNEFLNELPDSKDLTAVLDGSLIGEALLKAQAAIFEAELKLQQKLARQGKPTVDAATVCAQCPNIEVETKTIQVEEIRTRIIRGIPTQETVTVQKEVKQKVELPAEPVIPKTIPVKSEPKPPMSNSAGVIDSVSTSRNALASALKAASDEKGTQLTKEYIPPDGDWKALKQSDPNAYQVAATKISKLRYAHLFWYQIEVLKLLGENDVEKKNRLQAGNGRARWPVTLEEAQNLIPESGRKEFYNIVKRYYDTALISEIVSFEDGIKTNGAYTLGSI